MSQPQVEYEVVDDIGVITLNRPEKMNAMGASLLNELEDRFNTAKADPSVSVVLLQGAGPSFCAGYDLAPEDWILSQYGADFDGQGVCLAGAGELLGVADLAVAATDARFGHPAGRDLGIPVTLSFWPMLIGMRKTKELLFTSKLIDGREAERIGLVNQAVAPEDLDDQVWAMARDVARTAPTGLRMSKLATNRWFENMGLLASCYSTADLDTFFHQSPSYVEFFQAVRQGGMQEALRRRAEKYG